MKKTITQKIQIILIIAILIFSIIGIKSNANVTIEPRTIDPRNIENLIDGISQEIQSNLEEMQVDLQEDLQEDDDLTDKVVTNIKVDREPTNSAERLLLMMEGPLEEIDIAMNNLGRVFSSKEFQEEAEILKRGLKEVILDPLFQASVINLFGFFLVALGIKFILELILFIAKWRIYKKAGKPGWGLLLPVYRDVLMLEIAGLSPALLLMFFIFFIPIVGPFIFAIAYLTIRIIVAINVSKAFGQQGTFAIGLILLPTIFNSILGFGKSEYKKSKNKEVNVEEKEKEEKEEIIEAKIETVKEEPVKEAKVKTTTTKKTTETKKTTKKPKENE